METSSKLIQRHPPIPGSLHVYRLFLLIYIFFTAKNQAQQAQQQNPAWAGPTGITCLIGKVSSNLASSKPILCHPPILTYLEVYKTVDCM